MHETSYLKAELFVRHYGARRTGSGKLARVLEVGSKSYSEQNTYKPLFDSAHYAYVGLDVEAGPNVDIVPANGYVWRELESGSFDICISGQTFEHNPFFWITFSEIARILAPGGYAFIVAPGAGEVHRYPYDCWRFYPDAWLGLCAMTGMTLVESYFESDRTADVGSGGRWRDCAVIAEKPTLEGAALEAFHARLHQLTAPFATMDFSVDLPSRETGPCFADYERTILAHSPAKPLKRLGDRLRGRKPVRLLAGKAVHGG